MAADANLMRGARDAASGASKMAMAGSGELGKVAQGLIGRVDARTADLRKRTEEAKERSRQLDTIADARMEDAMLKANALGEAEYNLNSKKVKGWKKQLDRCPLGDEACKREIMSKMSMQSQSLQSEKQAREDNKELYKTLSLGVNSIDKYAMSVFSDPQKGDYTLTEDALGVKTYTIKYPEGTKDLEGNLITEKKYTGEEINKLFNKQHDLTSTKMTKDMAVDQIKIGAEGGAFDETKIKGSYEDAIGDDLMSAINDDWGLGSFRKNARDLVKTELEASPIDIDGDGKDDDIDAVMSALTNPNDPNYALMSDEDRKRYVVNYFVDAQKQQHKKGEEQAKAAASAERGKTLDKFKMEKHKAILRMMVDNNASDNEINEYISKVMTDAGVDTTTSTEVIVPDNFDIDSVDGETKVTINKNTALNIYDQLQSGKSEFIFGAQGTYFKREDKVDAKGKIIEKGGYEIFKGSRDNVEAQLRKENPYIDKIMNESESTTLEGAIKQYNAMPERKDLFRNMGGDGISRKEIEAREGTTEARTVDFQSKTTRKTFTKPESSNAKNSEFNKKDILSWLVNNPDHPDYQKVFDTYNS